MHACSRHPALVFFAGIFACFLVLAQAPRAAAAETLEQAMAYYLNGDVKKAVRDWERLARKGDADALFNLGQVQRLGQAGPADPRRAEDYYRRAANLGHGPAARELGRLYLFHWPVPENRAKGLALLEKAAANGDAPAEYLLGVLYFGGDILAADPVRAYAWMLLALEGGMPEAAQSEAAMRRALSEAEAARAFDLSRTFLTGTPKAAPYGLLLGEAPSPRRFSAAGSGPDGLAPPPGPSAVEQSALSVPEQKAEAMTEVVGRAAAAEDSASLNVAAAPAAGDDPMAAAMAANSEPPARDLGDPSSPLVDPEGFTGSWSVQLASFRTPEKADAEWRSLAKRHSEIFAGLARKIIRSDLGDELGVRYRLRAGPFAAKDAAAAACAALTEAGVGCLVVHP